MNRRRRDSEGRLRPLAVFVLGAALLAGCGAADGPGAPGNDASRDLSLLALGDSYTVGHSLPASWSWPWQLADSLAASGDSLQAVDVIAQTGWTTRDLLDAVRAGQVDGTRATQPFGLVTLMVGVNNQFQGLDLDRFAADLDTLLALAVDLAGGRPDGVLGFTIPDYGVTPVGSIYGTERIAEEIRAHNTLVRRVMAARGIAVVDITPLSLQAATDPGLVARDGLHYSAEMYARWVSLMLPAVRDALGLARPGS